VRESKDSGSEDINQEAKGSWLGVQFIFNPEEKELILILTHQNDKPTNWSEFNESIQLLCILYECHVNSFLVPVRRRYKYLLTCRCRRAYKGKNCLENYFKFTPAHLLLIDLNCVVSFVAKTPYWISLLVYLHQRKVYYQKRRRGFVYYLGGLLNIIESKSKASYLLLPPLKT